MTTAETNLGSHIYLPKGWVWLKWSVILCAITFIALTCIGIVRYYAPFPDQDDWDGSLEFFANVSAGDWRAWFAQNSEHRPVLPRIVYWADIKLFGAHFLFELIGGLIFAVAAWATLQFVARAMIDERAMRLVIGATITLLCASFMQITNFTIGFSAVPWFMLTFFVLATLVAVALSKNNQLAFCLALACGVAAAGTLANGLTALPLSVLLAYFIGIGVTRVAILTLVTGATFIAYFSNYVQPHAGVQGFGSGVGDPLLTLMDPVGVAHYTLTFIGNLAFYIVFLPLAGADRVVHLVAHGDSVTINKLFQTSAATETASDTYVRPMTPFESITHDHPVALATGLTAAQVFGLALIILLVVLGWRWLRSDRDPLRGALIMFVVFVFGSALAASLGRLSPYGLVEAISPRYTTLTLFACAALVILMTWHMNLRQASVLFLCVALALLPRQLTALRSRAAEYARHDKAMRALIENRDTEADRRELGDPQIVDRVAKRLRAMQNPPWGMSRLGTK